jgi:hypothetical protein
MQPPVPVPPPVSNSTGTSWCSVEELTRASMMVKKESTVEKKESISIEISLGRVEWESLLGDFPPFSFNLYICWDYEFFGIFGVECERPTDTES